MQIITETSEPAASEGVDTAETILFVKISRIAVSASDTAIKSVTVFPIMGGMSIAFLIFVITVLRKIWWFKAIKKKNKTIKV